MRPRLSLLSLSIVALVLCAPAASAQGWLEKAKQKANQVASEQLEKSPSSEKKHQGDSAPADDQSADAPATSGGKASGGDKAGAPMQGVWANFDFVPGNRVLFFEDYAQDNVGDFPRRWGFESGNWEIVDWQGARYLRSEGHGGA